MTTMLGGAWLQGLSLRVSDIDSLKWSPVESSVEVQGAGWAEIEGIKRLPLAREATHLANAERYEVPAAKARICSGLIYYTYLNSLFASRRTLLLDADNNYQEHPVEELTRAFYWRPRFTKRIEKVDGTCMVLRSAANNYYHTLVDNLPRLWVLHHPSLAEVPIRLLIPHGMRPAEKFFLERLLPPNVTVEAVTDGLYRAERIIISNFLSRQMSGYLPRAWLDFFLPRVLPDRPPQRRNRIFISRANAPAGRRILNEQAVVACLSEYGFHSYRLESLSLEEQIELFYDAEQVVAPHGAGLANLLFAQSAEVIELHPCPEIMPHYFFLSRALGHLYRFTCGTAATRNCDFSVDLSALKNLLDKQK